MYIAKYKLEKHGSGGAEIPSRITDGGYYFSPIDNTLLGWYDSSESEFFVDTSDSIVKVTKQNIIDRALAIHVEYPFRRDIPMKNEDVESSVILTNEEVVEYIGNWCDTFYNQKTGSNTGYIPSNDDVNEERERRIIVGCNVSISNVGTIYVTGSEKDIRNVAGLGQGAIVRIMNNDNTIVNFRDGNNNMYALSPQQLLELWQKSANYISLIYQNSWTIKAMSPIPQDFASDIYWSSNNL